LFETNINTTHQNLVHIHLYKINKLLKQHSKNYILNQLVLKSIRRVRNVNLKRNIYLYIYIYIYIYVYIYIYILIVEVFDRSWLVQIEVVIFLFQFPIFIVFLHGIRY